VARRAERLLTELMETEPVSPTALRYLNRLSDHLFVLSRALNGQGGDVLWEPGATR
jgi:cob(I)alamin adenosyltransferase